MPRLMPVTRSISAIPARATARAATGQHEIGPHAALAVGVCLEGAAETAAQHLAHHRVIIAAIAGSAPTPTLPRLRGRESLPSLSRHPPPQAGEGWGGG